MIIIGILGYNGAGKDTIADYLIQDYGFFKFSFGASLKDAVSAVFSWPRNALEGDTKESREWREQVDSFWGITPRSALETFGTELCRKHYDDNIWIKSLEKKISQCPKNARIVITDCRFQNEIEFIKRLGGILIRVERSPKPEWFTFIKQYNSGILTKEEASCELEKSSHITQWGSYLLEIQSNHVLQNEGSIHLLYKRVDEVMNKILEYNTGAPN